MIPIVRGVKNNMFHEYIFEEKNDMIVKSFRHTLHEVLLGKLNGNTLNLLNVYIKLNFKCQIKNMNRVYIYTYSFGIYLCQKFKELLN